MTNRKQNPKSPSFFDKRIRVIHLRSWMLALLGPSPLILAYLLFIVFPYVGLAGVILLLLFGSVAFDLALYIVRRVK